MSKTNRRPTASRTLLRTLGILLVVGSASISSDALPRTQADASRFILQGHAAGDLRTAIEQVGEPSFRILTMPPTARGGSKDSAYDFRSMISVQVTRRSAALLASPSIA